MQNYNQLAIEQRYQIYAFRKAGMSLSKIAKEIKCHKSTVSRELDRNKGKRGYRPEQAQRKASNRKRSAHKAVKLDLKLKAQISILIQQDWSPEQVSGYLKKQNLADISHESIYQFISTDKKSGGSLYLHLRCRRKKYKKRYGSNDRRGEIPNRKSIDERPKVVDEKSRIGDWEGDTVIGKNHKGALVTLVERKTKFTLMAYVPNKTAENVANSMVSLLKPYENRVHTITVDNGKEFAYHEDISQKLNAEIYFAHPYHSWERGLNENTNGLIRQYVPKKSEINTTTQNQLEPIMNKLNFRPRKSLNFDSPADIFYNSIKVSNVALVI
jgi:IS30 family transposase